MQTIRQKIFFLPLFCFGIVLLAVAQPSLKTTIDKSEILIGGQVHLKISVTLPRQDYFIKWLEADSLQHFDIVAKSKIDSVFSGGHLSGLSQTLVLTSFDSGQWAIPAFSIDLNPSAGDTTYNLYTDSFLVKVAYQADTTKALRDIKTIRGVEDETPWWYWAAGALGLLALLLIVYYLYRRNKKTMKPLAATSLPPYQKAMNELEQLKSISLSSPSSVKQYHSKLPEILKQYLTGTQGVNYESSTTGELLILLNQKNIDKTILSKTAAALRCSDAVKFAKYLPSQAESEESLQSVKQVIELIERISGQATNYTT